MIDEAAQTIEASLDALLVIWHTWASSEQVGQGYPSEAAGMKFYRVSRQYDTDNGALDGDVDAELGAAVDSVVQSLQDPYKTAIHINAKNLKTGVHDWGSRRLPFDPVERAKIVAEARAKMTRLLQSRGLM